MASPRHNSSLLVFFFLVALMSTSISKFSSAVSLDRHDTLNGVNPDSLICGTPKAQKVCNDLCAGANCVEVFCDVGKCWCKLKAAGEAVAGEFKPDFALVCT
ncbi:hypothetical protein LINGRAHAP2_LOCUS19204 [Linum grandiflorum]